MQGAKSFSISKKLVMNAYQRVKANKGSAGVDGITIEEFEKDYRNRLYKIWNRMSSGTYFPPPVKLVEIPKGDGGTRPLGIPTVGDRVAQMVVVLTLSPSIEPHFHENSYGYRPNRSAHDAISTARKRCWRYSWTVDLDVRKFFDTIDHGLLLKALGRHTSSKWVLLYIERWLKVPYKTEKGELIERTQGVPQGSVVGPLLANLFLHYAFDEWMRRNYPHIPFERYADDIICHCRTKAEAEKLIKAIKDRLGACKLALNETKTKIVYCKDSNRKGDYAEIQFDFLGYTFKPRAAKNKRGVYYTGFSPGISKKAQKRINQKMRNWKLQRWIGLDLKSIGKRINSVVRGWINYYGKFYPSALRAVLVGLNTRLVQWVRKKYKRFRYHKTRAVHWLGKIAKQHPNLFAHWKWGVKPAAHKKGCVTQ